MSTKLKSHLQVMLCALGLHTVTTLSAAELADGMHRLGGEVVQAETVAANLNRPWGMTFLPNGDLLVTEKNGGLQRLNGGRGPAVRIAGLPADLDQEMTNAIDNTGLFDVVVDPRFAETGRVFLSYASRAEDGVALRVASYRLERNRLSDEKEVLRAAPGSRDRFHYGGSLLFEDEETLIVTSGERVARERGQGSVVIAQNPADLRGKILRVRRDGSAAPGNPGFADPRIYAIGVRNPQGIARDPTSDRIWFSEHGPIAGDELNVLRGGANYGWPQTTCGRYKDEGYEPPVRDTSRDTAPVRCWSAETFAPAGIAFYTGKMFPKWRNKLLIAGLSAGRFLLLDVKGEQVDQVQVELIDTPTRLRDVAVAPDGAVYLAVDGERGRIIRLSASR